MTDPRALTLQSLDALSKDVPYTHTQACHLLFDLVSLIPSPEVVEVSCAYGKATLYLTAAAKRRGGFVHSVDIDRPIWGGRGADDLLCAAGLQDACQIAFKEDARWYLVDLFRRRPGTWIDLAYVDASHTVEVDAFVALALWTHLRPGGLIVFDDLDWVPSVYAPEDDTFSRPTVSHVKAIYDYICQLPLVEKSAEWGADELEWTWGFVRKGGGQTGLGASMFQLLKRAR